jgi:serine/threonine protein kinase
MARLSHPNVVAALDMGVFGDQVFLVMELVRGPTVAVWLKAKPRTWREVLEVYLDAGEGLAAAHGLGVIHRDFKPQNVLIGLDGKARVSDFGLARLVASEVAAPSRLMMKELSVAGNTDDIDDGKGEGGRPQAATATVTGAVNGTPRYMAPEQFLGHPADHRTDQFSFCVALFEGLFGRHPFVDEGPKVTGPSYEDRFRVAVLAGREPAPTASGGVPRGVVTAVLRGLSLEPERRFPSFPALLAALRRAGALRLPKSARRKMAVMVIAALAVMVAAAATLRRSATPDRAQEPPPLVPTEKPSAWAGARVLLKTPDVIHCLMSLDSSNIRIVWGSDARTAEDVNIATGARTPTDLLPETYRWGCPVLSPDGHHLIYEGYDANNRPYIFHASNSTGVGAQPLVSSAEPTYGSHPRWLGSSRHFIFDVSLQYPAVFSLDSGVFDILPDRERLADGSITGFNKEVSRDGHRLSIAETGRDGVKSLSIYRWPGLELMTKLRIAKTSLIWKFGWNSDVIYGRGFYGPTVDLVAFNLRSGKLSSSFDVPGWDVGDLLPLDRSRAAVTTVASRYSLWYRNASGRELPIPQPPSGSYIDASVQVNGDVLLTEDADCCLRLAEFHPDTGQTNRLTNGPFDFSPSALPDGTWLMGRTDRAGKDSGGIFRCASGRGGSQPTCLPVNREIPLQYVAAAPDGQKYAYHLLRGDGVVLRIAALAAAGAPGGAARDLAIGTGLCQIPWSSPTTLWFSRRQGAEFRWVEIDVESNRPTGRIAGRATGCFDGYPETVLPVAGPIRLELSRTSQILVGTLPDPP